VKRPLWTQAITWTASAWARPLSETSTLRRGHTLSSLRWPSAKRNTLCRISQSSRAKLPDGARNRGTGPDAIRIRPQQNSKETMTSTPSAQR